MTSDTIKWKRGRTEDHHYINHLSVPRLPLSIICAPRLMGFVCSHTNFTVNITIMSPRFTPASQDDGKTKGRSDTGRKQKRKAAFTTFTQVQSTTVTQTNTAGSFQYTTELVCTNKSILFYCTKGTWTFLTSKGTLYVLASFELCF